MYRINKILLLSKSDLRVFHTRDLATLWQLDNANTLYTTIKRYVQNKSIFRIQKGLYSLVEPEKLDPVLVARKLINGHCYLSLEIILFEHGYKSQRPVEYTFVGAKPLKTSWNNLLVRCYQLNEKFLMNNAGTYVENGIRRASVQRAICDALYFNKNRYFDKRVNWREIKMLQKEIGYEITSRSK